MDFEKLLNDRMLIPNRCYSSYDIRFLKHPSLFINAILENECIAGMLAGFDVEKYDESEVCFVYNPQSKLLYLFKFSGISTAEFCNLTRDYETKMLIFIFDDNLKLVAELNDRNMDDEIVLMAYKVHEYSTLSVDSVAECHSTIAEMTMRDCIGYGETAKKMNYYRKDWKDGGHIFGNLYVGKINKMYNECKD